MIQVQNVTFFSEKNMILISRGVKQTWLAKTQGGALVVKLKGFDRYFFDPDTCRVYSKKSDKKFSAIKKHKEEQKHYFWLYKNGIRNKVHLSTIIRENMSGIELFLDNKKEKENHLKLIA